MLEKYGDEFTAAAAEMYREYFNLDMGEKEQMILAAYKSATEAASWFRLASLLENEEEYPSADDPYIELDGRRYFKVKRFARYDEFDFGAVARRITACASGTLASGSPSCIALSTHDLTIVTACGYASPISSLAITRSLLEREIISPASISLAA